VPVLPGHLGAEGQPVVWLIDLDDAVDAGGGRQRAQHGAEGDRRRLLSGEDVIAGLAEDEGPLGLAQRDPLPDRQLARPVGAGAAFGVVEDAQFEVAVVPPDRVGAQHVPYPQPAARLAQVGDVHAHVLPRQPGQAGDVVSLDPDAPHPPGDGRDLRYRSGHRDQVEQAVAGTASGRGCLHTVTI